jgi:hypothetical protein
MTTAPIVALAELSDEQPQERAYSPRLHAVLRRLPKFNGVRIANALYNNDVWTLATLCTKKRADLRRWKHIGKKCVSDLEQALGTFGLALADIPHPIVVERPIDVRVEQLRRWIGARLARCEATPDDGTHAIVRSILSDVQLILGGHVPADDPQEAR